MRMNRCPEARHKNSRLHEKDTDGDRYELTGDTRSRTSSDRANAQSARHTLEIKGGSTLIMLLKSIFARKRDHESSIHQMCKVYPQECGLSAFIIFEFV